MFPVSDSEGNAARRFFVAGDPAAVGTSALLPAWLPRVSRIGIFVGLVWSLVLIGVIWHFFLASQGYVDYVDGLVLFHQTQAAAGQNIYASRFQTAPPYSVALYGPVFYYLVGCLLGERPSLLPGRIVSMLSVLALSAASWWVLRRRFHAPLLIAAIGTVPWLVLRGPFEFAVNNRVDSLAIFFGVSGLMVSAFGGRRGWAWSVPLLLLAGFTKPTAAVAPALAVLMELLAQKHFRAAVVFAGTLAAAVYGLFWLGDRWSSGCFSICLLHSHAATQWNAGMGLVEGGCKQVILPAGIIAGCLLLRDASTRIFGLHAVICFALTAVTAAKIGSNYNYFIEPSWAALFCFALVLSKRQSHPLYHCMLAATAVLLIQSAARITPHVEKHYQRIDQWPRTMLAVEKYGQRGPLLTMHVGAQVLAGQQPYVADVFILSCLSKAGKFDVSPILEDLRRQRIAAVIARDDIRPEAVGDVIWTDSERQVVAEYYRPIERFGEWTVYIPRLEPRADVFLRPSNNDEWTGRERGFYQNGQKASEVNVARGRKHGIEQLWDNGGHLWCQRHYVHGVQEGLEVMWYENGQKASSVEYVKGLRQGLETTWYEDGQKWTETPYAAGAPHGIATRWNPDGSKAAQTRWDHGITQ